MNIKERERSLKDRESIYSNFNEQYNDQYSKKDSKLLEIDNIATTQKATEYDNEIINQTPSLFQNSDNELKEFKDERDNQDPKPFVSNWENQTAQRENNNHNHFYKKSDRESNTFTFNRPNDDNYFGTDSRGNDIANEINREYGGREEYNNKPNDSDIERVRSDSEFRERDGRGKGENSNKEPYDSQANHNQQQPLGIDIYY